MNNPNHQEMVQKAVKQKFGRRKTLNSTTAPRYPTSAEREFQRINRAYLRIFNEALQKHLPEIKQLYKQERNDARFDSSLRLTQKLRQIMQEIADEMEQKIGDFGLDERIKKIATITGDCSTREWRQAVKKTLGVDIFSDYYKGETYRDALNKWIAENVALIKDVPSKALSDIEKIISDGYQAGKNLGQLQDEIHATYEVSKKKAGMLARDQVAKLNASITKMQQTDAGVKKYKWSTSKDARVRECHQELEGQIFSWDDPPEMWYQTKSGVVFTGRKCNPGEDYCCRCVAIPVFDWNTIDVPIN